MLSKRRGRCPVTQTLTFIRKFRPKKKSIVISDSWRVKGVAREGRETRVSLDPPLKAFLCHIKENMAWRSTWKSGRYSLFKTVSPPLPGYAPESFSLLWIFNVPDLQRNWIPMPCVFLIQWWKCSNWGAMSSFWKKLFKILTFTTLTK